MSDTKALMVDGVSHEYATSGGKREVLHDVSLSVETGRTLAVVGESGAGKSTLIRIIAGLERPTAGTVLVGGAPPVLKIGRASPVQMVFQQPVEALNRFVGIGSSLREALRHLPKADRAARVAHLLDQVGIDPARAAERPGAFSGGQLQRIVIARALGAEPELLLCDEPTSALDVSVQAQIVNLLLALQEERRFACLLVTHDLGVARVLADDILVLQHGRVAELTEADAFFEGPRSEEGATLLRMTQEQSLARSPAAGVAGPVADLG